MTDYVVEYAKSGRATCKKCKEKIGKGELRIGNQSEHPDGFSTCAWYHPGCYTVPRKLGASAEEFVNDHLQDISEDNGILPAKADELIENIMSKPAAKKKDGSTGVPFIDKLKAEFDAMDDGNDDKKKLAKKGGKKRKADDSDEDDGKKSKKSKSDDNPSAVELYGKYHKMGNDQLKDLLRWNRQIMKGTKPVLIAKVVDMALHGRFARCKMCDGGKLKMNDDCTKVVCSGDFDEDTQTRIPCDFTCKPEKAPRSHPVFTEEPTEEQKEAMDREERIAKGEEEEDDSEEVDDNSDLGKLLKAAESIKIDMSNRPAIKESAVKMIDLLEDSDAKLDLPDEDKQIRVQVGKILMANVGESPRSLMKKIVKHFGFIEQKAAKAAKKKESAGSKVKCEENGELYLAFKELADIYFKQKNAHAGNSYRKAAAAISELKVAVTADNAKAMGKAGKNKVEGIGKGSADKMYEFVTTGTIEKLEQKRAEAE